MLLVITPYDKSSLGAIEKAIMASDLGINPTNDGNVIRLAFPPLTEERRKELVKVVRHKAEEAKVAVRNLRRSGRHELDALQKDGSLSTDELEQGRKGAGKDHPRAGERHRSAAGAKRARAPAGLRGRRPWPTTATDPDEEGDVNSEVPAGFEDDPPSYRSGRVRIIGAEPAGNAVHEVTGPVVEENPDMPHWNDAPTGQVPAILDRGNGDEQALAPPSWREEDTDWAAHEELFEPSMLSDEVARGGFDDERQQRHRRHGAPALALRHGRPAGRRHPGH